MPLTLTTGGRTLIFRPDGEVAVRDGGTETAGGTWRATAGPEEEKVNRFLYTLEDAAETPVRARYAFNQDNQLEVVLEAEDGQSDPALLAGGIEVDDQHDIVYRLVESDGTPTGQIVTLYGDLSIENNTNALLIELTGGGVARVLGDNGIRSLEAAQNRIASLAADDLLRFRATTGNEFDDGAFFEMPAKLEFAGSWDVRDGQLVFLSKVAGDLSRPDVRIGFGGKLGAITAGFVYFADSTGTKAAFNIRGQHVFQSADAETDFNWQVALGFSDKKFAAKVDFDLDRVTQDGRRLGLAGNLSLRQADGGTVEMGLSLEAEYEWQDHAIVFKARVNSEAGNFNYDLMLQGRFKFDHGSLTFGIHYTNAAGAPALAIDLAFTGDRDNFLQSVAFHLQISPGKVEFTLGARFNIRQRFVAGVGRVLEQASATGE